MKFNGTIFSKPQQDQLKENIGNELEKVTAKVDDVEAKVNEVDANAMKYRGEWGSKTQYYTNDVVKRSTGDTGTFIALHDNKGITPNPASANPMWIKIG